MEAPDLFYYLLELPEEIQCYVLSGPLTLLEFLSARTTSPIILNRLNQCLQYLASPEEEGSLSPEIAMELRSIRTITPTIPISITQIKQLITLASHRTLHEASFDLTMALEGDFDLFSSYLLEFLRHCNKIRGNAAWDCQERYNFTLYTKSGDEFFQVKEGSLLVMGDVLSSAVIAYLLANIPVCKYQSDLLGIHGRMTEFPNLTRITMFFNSAQYEDHDLEGFYIGLSFGRWILQVLLSTTATEFFALNTHDLVVREVEDPEESAYSYDDLIGDMFQDLPPVAPGGRQLLPLPIRPDITTFFPIPLVEGVLQSVQRLLPGLTSIAITTSSVERISFHEAMALARLYLRNYPRIILVDNLDVQNSLAYYRLYFPQELHSRLEISLQDVENK